LLIAQQMPLPLTISCSSKSRLVLTVLVLPFWYLLTQVVPDIFQKCSKTVVCVCVVFSVAYFVCRFVELDFVCSIRAKRLAGNSISRIAYIMSSGTFYLSSVNQCNAPCKQLAHKNKLIPFLTDAFRCSWRYNCCTTISLSWFQIGTVYLLNIVPVYMYGVRLRNCWIWLFGE